MIIFEASTEGIFIEGVNFQRITNSTRTHSSWFRLKYFKLFFLRKMQSELGKCHSGGVFTKFRLVVKRKGGNYLELKLFTRGILCGASGGVKTLPHVYLGLVWALLFKASVVLETLNDLIAQIHKGLWTQRFRWVIDFSFWCQRWFPKFQLLEKLQYLDSIVKDKVRSTKQLICFQKFL